LRRAVSVLKRGVSFIFHVIDLVVVIFGPVVVRIKLWSACLKEAIFEQSDERLRFLRAALVSS
jgi:hypothetical protein